MIFRKTAIALLVLGSLSVIILVLIKLFSAHAGDSGLTPTETEHRPVWGGIYARGHSRGGTVSEQIWADPGISGLVVLLDWNKVQLGPNKFDFAEIDQALAQAVKFDKHITLSIAAGKHGTPDWLFDNGVTGYQFQDYASSDERADSCGSKMTLASPTDENFQSWYFDLIKAISTHISKQDGLKERVAYVKLSGANLFTHEIRLPNRCKIGCLCNGEVWSKAGYTPEKLSQFLLKQTQVWLDNFPEAKVIYPLIQDGLPDLNENGDYEMASGKSSGAGLVKSSHQVSSIIKAGVNMFNNRFVVSHNGLKFNHAPNSWVVSAGELGASTGFQTVNLEELNTLPNLQKTLINLADNTNAHYLEVYFELLIMAIENDGKLTTVNSSKTYPDDLSGWNELLKKRADN